jgi:hypothetical protein
MDLVKLAEESLSIVSSTPSYIPVSMGTERKAAAAQLIQDPEATATAVHRAVTLILGNMIQNWEPESIWLGLRDHGIEIPRVNCNKVLALNVLFTYPAFYWEVNAFEDTALALNNEKVLPEVLQEASPAQLSWAVYEVEILIQSTGQDPEFDYEPAKYAAVSLHREGFLVTPELLGFAQRELDRLIRGHQELIPEIKKRWDELDKEKLDTVEFQENPVDVQLAQLAAVYLYVRERAQRYKEDLGKLYG